MRVLGIETSSERGSVALLDGETLVAFASHEEPQAHGERLPGLMDAVMAESGCSRGSIDRLAVGTGPGSFTGLRVGIAFAQGIALGLARPVVGVGSLRAMATSVPGNVAGARCAVLDARRGEAFVAAYSLDGGELFAPVVVPLDRVDAVLASSVTGEKVLCGTLASAIPSSNPVYRSSGSDRPSAEWTARLASTLTDLGPATAQYIRPADAIPPKMPPSPLSSSSG